MKTNMTFSFHLYLSKDTAQIKNYLWKLTHRKVKIFEIGRKIDQQCKMPYSESELDFSFAIDSVSDFESASESESESSSALMNLDICIFFTL